MPSASTTIPLLVLAPPSPTGNRRMFSTGRLFIQGKNPGDALVELAILQDISTDINPGQKVDLFAAPQVSMFAVDRAYHSGSVKAKAKTATINHEGLEVIAGMSAAVAPATANGSNGVGQPTGRVKQSLTKQVGIPSLLAIFEGQDDQGQPVFFRLLNARAGGMNLPFSFTNYTMPDFEMEGFPDVNKDIIEIETAE
jgi:hypothetical protein